MRLMTKKLSKSRKIVFYAVMVGLTLGICFIITEYVFSRYYYSDISQSTGLQFDPVLGWRLRPGTYWVKPDYNFRKHIVHINSLGFRNDELTESMIDSDGLIIFLGDSFTHGRKIRNEDLFTTLVGNAIEQQFQHKAPRVLNAGVSGYGTAQQLLLMSVLAEEKNVVGDIYAVMAFTNDILDNLGLTYGGLEEIPLHPRFALDDEGRLRLVRLPEEQVSDVGNGDTRQRRHRKLKFIHVVKMRLEGFLQTKPGFMRFLNKLGIKANPSRLPGLLNGWYREDILDSGIPLMRALLAEMKHEAEKHDSKLVVSFIPSMIQVYSPTYGPMLKNTFPDDEVVDRWLEDPTRPQRLVGRMCEELDIPFQDLYPAFLANNRRDLYIPRDGHLNKNGHSLVAKEVTEFLIPFAR